jgi:hypothetical protein
MRIGSVTDAAPSDVADDASPNVARNSRTVTMTAWSVLDNPNGTWLPDRLARPSP